MGRFREGLEDSKDIQQKFGQDYEVGKSRRREV